MDRSDMAGLEALAERYPWFAGAQILRSVASQKAGEVLSTEALHLAAAHVPSRGVLFAATHRPRPAAPPTYHEVREPAAASVQAVIEADMEDAPIHTGQAAAIAPLPAEKDTAPPLAMESPAVQVPAGDTIPETPVAPDVELGSMAPPPVAPEPGQRHTDQGGGDVVEDPLERQILESALASAYDLTWAQERTVHAKRADPIKPVEDALVFPPQGPLVPQAPLAHKPALTRHGRYRFTAWLEADAHPAMQISAGGGGSGPSVLADRFGMEQQATSQEAGPTEAPEPAANPLPGEPMATADLIDAFIRQQVPSPPVKTSFFTPQQAAKRSLDDKAGLVTETLARVYANQGNIPKAVEAYKRLALKYPEKSAYFAALQKELEGQLNK